MSENIRCVDCSSVFEFTDGEASFYETKGLKKPRRCKLCRAAKKMERAKKVVEQETQAMHMEQEPQF